MSACICIGPIHSPSCPTHGEAPVGGADPINPDHYKSGGIECIDAITAALGVEGASNFCRGNALKYLWRGGKKDEVTQDLKKAIWYINKEIELRGGL